MQALRIAVAAAAAIGLVAELDHALASRGVPSPDVNQPVAVVVLGYRSRRRGRPHPLQRWRVAIGVRSLSRHAEGVLVLSGAARPGGPSEARVMAHLAVDAGIPPARLVLEEQATTTWENVALTGPLVEAYPQVAYASAPTHAARARAYLSAQRPDLVARLVAADDYRALERPGLKIATTGRRIVRVAHDCWQPLRQDVDSSR